MVWIDGHELIDELTKTERDSNPKQLVADSQPNAETKVEDKGTKPDQMIAATPSDLPPSPSNPADKPVVDAGIDPTPPPDAPAKPMPPADAPADAVAAAARAKPAGVVDAPANAVMLGKAIAQVPGPGDTPPAGVAACEELPRLVPTQLEGRLSLVHFGSRPVWK